MDALITAISFVLAYYIKFYILNDGPGIGVLPVQEYYNLPFFLLGFGIKFLFFCKKRMGKLYLKGLAEGWKRTVGPVGKQAKVHFQWSHLWNYVKIQWQLYLNVFRILMKS